MSPITEAAPAKVNLALHVSGRRDDGYHLIDTLVVFAGHGDVIEVAPAASDRLDLDGPFAHQLSAPGDNLVVAARDFLRRSNPDRTGGPVSIRLEKNLPVASGLGGGSSDAAATLRALARLWQIGERGWQAGAVTLGADVPMCLAARSLLARGIGDRLEPIEALPALFIVLANPGVAVATPQVFAALDTKTNPPLPRLPESRGREELLAWLKATRNDLQKPALSVAPQIATVLAELENRGAALARMSGSGATCFGIFDDADGADRAAIAIARNHPSWFVVSTRTSSPESHHHVAA